jgi:hypothetical protein
MIRRSNLKPCGTSAAYRRHLRDGQDPCDACREAENLRTRKGRPKRPEPVCGTRRGYDLHRRNGEEPCASCRMANAAEQEEWRRGLATRDAVDIPHGLNRYGNYGCRCDVCKAAKSADNRKHAEARKRRRQEATQ